MLDEIDVNDIAQSPLSKRLPLLKVPFEGIWIGIGEVILDELSSNLCDRDHEGFLEREYKQIRHRTMTNGEQFPVSRYEGVRGGSGLQRDRYCQYTCGTSGLVMRLGRRCSANSD